MGGLIGRRVRLCALMGVVACGRPPVAATPATAATLNSLTAAERQVGWRLLFDGGAPTEWRGYMAPDLPAGWQSVDGALTRVGEGGDIVTRETYRNFELALEWKISSGGNSGIMYRVIEGPAASYFSGPEMQVLDDGAHPDGKSPLTSAGSDFALYPARRGAVKPAGEWNLARLLVNGNHVEHWLNGIRVVEYELGSPDWIQRVARSKFQQWVEYGKSTAGHVALQDHGNWVAYRNIKIRVLP